MSTLEQEATHKEQLGKLLSELDAIKPEDLVREAELGRGLSFREAVPYFRRALGLFHALHESNLDGVPQQRLNQLIQYATQAKGFFDQVQAFAVEKHPQNTVGVRDSLVAQIRDNYPTWFDQISPILAYSVRKGTDFERLEREARETVEAVKSEAAGLKREAGAVLVEMRGVLDQVKRAAAEVGVAQHAQHFDVQAKEEQEAANQWLRVSVILAVATVGLGVLSLWFYADRVTSMSVGEAIQLAIGKVIVFSVLFSSLVASGRIYRTHRHNYTVNKHRQNALKTFETFAKAAVDEQTKSAVLLQATQCIFSPQHSGYVTQESDAAGHAQVLEIFRNIAAPHNK